MTYITSWRNWKLETRSWKLKPVSSNQYPASSIVPVIADIRHPDRLRAIFAEHRPEIVFHAAAHKHVPLMECNVEDAVRGQESGIRRQGTGGRRIRNPKFTAVPVLSEACPEPVEGSKGGSVTFWAAGAA